MHLLRVLRCICLLEIIAKKHQHESFTAAYVNPKKSSAFSALYIAYIEAKKLAPKYVVFVLIQIIITAECRGGKVRVVNAEERHRPKGYEDDPRSAVWVITDKQRVSRKCGRYTCQLIVQVLCTLAMLQNVVSTALNDANVLMDRMGLPVFTRYMLEKVQGNKQIFTMILSFADAAAKTNH
jgi:hypothetical protein